ncbi:CRP-like cAMP-binding protein [Actinokineospora baliensis]|uniref:Crp/Fnr family transcriptional regulator n=1 Tax=Actinokineospora baliensis TaxID=547056 RepID=UPI00195855B9|nr:Crp/Fnr family transcriptional regulator [Actinokineospora baliensis]MBM7771289.1 CRP-like cAMP-binding protein [Actinokineospora baliensis]
MDDTEQPGTWLPGTFLTRLVREDAAELLSLARKRTATAGELLLTQGQPRTDVLLLGSSDSGSSACVKVTAVARNGWESLLGIRFAGDVVGEMAALGDGARSATVTACGDLVVHVMPHRDFFDFLMRHPLGWAALCGLMAERLTWANRRRLDFMGYDVRTRLARVLLELAEQHGQRTDRGVELGVELTQEEMGKLIGARPDSVGQAWRALKVEGLVTSRRRGLLLYDVDALRVAAGED